MAIVVRVERSTGASFRGDGVNTVVKNAYLFLSSSSKWSEIY